MSEAADPEIGAITAICTALSSLDSDEKRQRVLDYAYAKFKLKNPSGGTGGRDRPSHEEGERGDDAEFFSKFEHTKPAANVALLVARHYSRYGAQPFTTAEIKEQADAAGLVVPARIDMTLNDSGRRGKRFYQRLGPGRYRVTVHGETFLKDTYGVKKGTARSAAEQESDR